ncbi:MAG TPA: lipid-binding SYLF domain-containing protein [Nitrospira sp.]|nr:lipid-binding SYLF domain-containing protein [Nitrospira sp.]
MEHPTDTLTRCCAAAFGAVLFAFVAAGAVWADDREQRDLVDQSRMTLENFLAGSNMGWFRDHIKDARGLFIVPQFLKAAFFFGGAGGSGVFVAKDQKTGEWSEPAFFTMGAGSFGFQFGAQASEVVLLVLTQKGVDGLLLGNFKLGADGSVAVGPVGAGVAGATTPNLSVDLLSFVRAKGLFAGVSLEGAVLAARDEWSRQYYGKPVSPADILIRHEVKNPHSESLRLAIVKAADAKYRPKE